MICEDSEGFMRIRGFLRICEDLWDLCGFVRTWSELRGFWMIGVDSRLFAIVREDSWRFVMIRDDS
jgi:hypothetical protein